MNGDSKSGSQYALALESIENGSYDDLQKMSKVTKALPEGVSSLRLYKDVVHIAWPSFMELILTQLTSMADLMMVGQLGTWAISAVGLTSQPKFLLMTTIIALNVGATALVARYKGMGDIKKANKVIRQAILLTLFFSLAASIIGYVFAEPMVKFMGADGEKVLQGGADYLKIQMVGFVFVGITSTITACLRGVGDTRISMIYNLIANVVNIFFNWLLIYGNWGFPRMEVAGASLATIIGQTVAFIIAIWVIIRGRSDLRLDLKEGFKPDYDLLRNISKIGIPSMFENIVMRIGIIIYAITVASLGTDAYATHQVCMSLQALSFMNGQAFAVSATTLMGQSLGKKRPDMAQAYCNRTQRLGMYVSLILMAVFTLFGREIIMLYNTDSYVVETGAKILFLLAFTQPFQASQFILAGALRGAGDTKATARITTVTVLVLRPAIAILLIKVFNTGLIGAWIALAADQLARTLLVGIRYKSGKWKTAYVEKRAA